MKKAILLILAFAMTFMLVACGGESPSADSGSVDSTSSETENKPTEENDDKTESKVESANKPALSSSAQANSNSGVTSSKTESKPQTTTSSKPATSSGSILGVWEPCKITVTSYGKITDQMEYDEIISEYGKTVFAFDNAGNHVEYNSEGGSSLYKYSYKNGKLAFNGKEVKTDVSGSTFTFTLDEDGESEVIKVEFRRKSTITKSELIGKWFCVAERMIFGDDGYMRQPDTGGLNKYTYDNGILISYPSTETNPDLVDWTFLIIKDGDKVMMLRPMGGELNLVKIE